MAESLTIPKDKPGEPSQNYEVLRREGLSHIETLAHRLWTDYNVHDPGVTILELLCYAMTDLGYRISFPLEDLISAEKNTAGAMSRHFHSALTILPSCPLTEEDYRRLLLDIEGVRNAWIEKAVVDPLYLDCSESRLTTEKPGKADTETIT
ncbi:MAG TPA: hypothetical protein VN260_05280, partial [Dissulfurispiraceae bacterium]|nr:hypothetical protein [Dissulfurispiraceae bacterium]